MQVLRALGDLSLELSTLIRDEQGNYSSARCSWWLTLIWTLATITRDSFNAGFNVPPAGYALLGTVTTLAGVWAAGPRIAQYVGPQMGAMIGAIGKAKGDEREPDRFRDDERG